VLNAVHFAALLGLPTGFPDKEEEYGIMHPRLDLNSSQALGWTDRKRLEGVTPNGSQGCLSLRVQKTALWCVCPPSNSPWERPWCLQLNRLRVHTTSADRS
jgi:hypothetical protein